MPPGTTQSTGPSYLANLVVFAHMNGILSSGAAESILTHRVDDEQTLFKHLRSTTKNLPIAFQESRYLFQLLNLIQRLSANRKLRKQHETKLIQNHARKMLTKL
jgi:hypothetical protein